MRSGKIMTVCIVTVLGLLALCVPAQAVPGMVSYWTFDEGSGNIAHDLANGNHGTIYGANWTTGIVNNALSFDGDNDLVNISTFPTTTRGSFEVWINPNEDLNSSNTNHRVVMETANAILWHLGGDAGLRFGVHHPVGSWQYTIGTTPLSSETWYYVVGSWDGTYIRLFINGVQNGITALGSTANYIWDAAIGARPYPDQRWYFNGLIDEVAIYNRALTGSEIWDSYVGVKAAYLLHNLVDQVVALNLQKGIANSLDAKLSAVLQALDDINENNDVAAINALQAFINAVEAQRGKQISQADADALIATAQEIIDLLTAG